MKIGVFGGAFDPFHQEHKKIIVASHDELGLDKVVLLPSYMPPHKKGEITPYADRRAMIEAGCSDLPYVVIDDLEKERATVNPTFVTLPILKEKYPSDEFFFIMGGDSAANFHKWINPQIIADTAKLVVVARKGSGNVADAARWIRETFSADVRLLSFCGDFVSSSAIKAAVTVGLEPNGLSKEVFDVVCKNKLYSSFSDLVERVKTDVPEKTFWHVARTAVYAEEFRSLLGLKYEDVFLAGLLHDCAKHLSIEMNGVPSPVVHQFSGADLARDRYGVTDEGILDAIRYHTTGKPNMSALGKLIFCADILEPGRKYDGVDELRKIISSDFEKGFVACVKRSYDHLVEKGGEIYYLTKECLDFYNK